VIAEPPVFVGALKLTVALPLPFETATSVGVPGSADVGVTGEDAVEELPEPLPFVADTVKV
jgi:hypothetical protein